MMTTSAALFGAPALYFCFGEGQWRQATLNGFTRGFHDIQHSLPKDEVAALRKFLTDAGVDPVRDYPL